MAECYSSGNGAVTLSWTLRTTRFCSGANENSQKTRVGNPFSREGRCIPDCLWEQMKKLFVHKILDYISAMEPVEDIQM